MPGFEICSFRQSKGKLCVIYVAMCFCFMVLKVLDCCISSKEEVFCVSINDSLKLDFPLAQFLHTFGSAY